MSINMEEESSQIESNGFDNSRSMADFGATKISWEIPEHEKYYRTRRWYIIAATVSLILLIFSFFTSNFLFAVIVIIAAFVLILRDGQEPNKINFSLTDEGVILGKKFYDYDVFKNFSIVYKPNLEIKNLYFEFKNPVHPRLSIPLLNMNPLPIRDNLLKYLAEDLERTDQPLSEALAKLFKL